MKIDLPNFGSPSNITILVAALTRFFRDVVTQINALGSGSISGVNNASSSFPTSGSYAVGDYVRNSMAAEIGSAGSKYIVLGWVYTTAGWKQCRALTGN